MNIEKHTVQIHPDIRQGQPYFICGHRKSELVDKFGRESEPCNQMVSPTYDNYMVTSVEIGDRMRKTTTKKRVVRCSKCKHDFDEDELKKVKLYLYQRKAD